MVGHHEANSTTQHSVGVNTRSVSEDDSTPVCVAMRWPQSSMCPVRGTTVNMHTTRNSMHKNVNFYHFQNHVFTIKVWGQSTIFLTDGYLWLWRFISSSQKWIHLSKSPQVISVSKLLSFLRFSMAVAHCYTYNGWNLNTGSSCNAWWTVLETSSGSVCTCLSFNLFAS